MRLSRFVCEVDKWRAEYGEEPKRYSRKLYELMGEEAARLPFVEDWR